MRETIESLRSTIDVMKRTDSAQIVEAQTRVEDKLQRLDKKLSEAVFGTKDEVLAKVEHAKGQLTTTVEGFGEKISQAKKSIEIESKGARMRQFMIIALLIINFATLVYVGFLANQI